MKSISSEALPVAICAKKWSYVLIGSNRFATAVNATYFLTIPKDLRSIRERGTRGVILLSTIQKIWMSCLSAATSYDALFGTCFPHNRLLTMIGYSMDAVLQATDLMQGRGSTLVMTGLVLEIMGLFLYVIVGQYSEGYLFMALGSSCKLMAHLTF